MSRSTSQRVSRDVASGLYLLRLVVMGVGQRCVDGVNAIDAGPGSSIQ
jgi:hypothetical protein